MGSLSRCFSEELLSDGRGGGGESVEVGALAGASFQLSPLGSPGVGAPQSPGCLQCGRQLLVPPKLFPSGAPTGRGCH